MHRVLSCQSVLAAALAAVSLNASAEWVLQKNGSYRVQVPLNTEKLNLRQAAPPAAPQRVPVKTNEYILPPPQPVAQYAAHTRPTPAAAHDDEMMRLVQQRILNQNAPQQPHYHYHTHTVQPPEVPPTAHLMLPVNYRRVSSHYGMRIHPTKGGWRMHTGVDFAAPTGTPIRAAQAGYVRFSGWKGGYGKAVIVQHNDRFATLYGHASQLRVRKGQFVRAGQVIANVGSTGESSGPHLHFEVLDNGVAKNPRHYLRF